jgi:hypothetical protein
MATEGYGTTGAYGTGCYKGDTCSPNGMDITPFQSRLIQQYASSLINTGGYFVAYERASNEPIYELSYTVDSALIQQFSSRLING